MKIGIDISQAVYEGTGVARFTEGLTRAIIANPHGHTWTFFYYHFRRDLPAALLTDIKQAGHEIVTVPLPPKIMTYIWNTLHIWPIDTLIPGMDWFITSDWTEPPARCKKATIVHDLAFKRFPETVDPGILAVMQQKLALVAKESSLIFADSAATKADLAQYYQVTDNKVQVVYPGVQPITPHVPDPKLIKEKFQITKPYLLTVGKLEPRKNLKRLFAAFQKMNNPEIELVVVGQKGWGDMPAPIPGIVMAGFVSDSELHALYAGAQGLVFPSVWEGFGYPAVEAMQHGIPTALSNRSSLAEIGAQRAFLFDPESVDEIVKALQALLTDTGKRAAYIKTGLEYVQGLTWSHYLEQCIQALEKV